MVLETAIVALTTFIATIGPFDVAIIFAALTAGIAPKARRRLAVRGVLIAFTLLLLFALFGELLLRGLGISLAALQTGGGILLLLMGIEMVFARPSGAMSATPEEQEEAEHKPDIAIFPLAMPLIAGPGALGASILLMSNASGSWVLKFTVLGALLTVGVITFISLLVAARLQRYLGLTGTLVISRIFGFLLTALAVQFIFNGIMQSGLVAH